LENWRCQFGTSNKEKKGLRIPPYVFTELGVAMLSSVLNSKLSKRIDQLESGINKIFKVVFQRLDAVDEATPALRIARKKIGLNPKD
jgi:ABC-type phosphate transport system auxiliary subunit